MSMREQLDLLARRRAESEQGGGPARIKAQHDKGKLSARERLDILLDDGLTSRRHARIALDGGGWRLHDLGSRNGGFVDGAAFAGGSNVGLRDGAVIRLGDTLAVFSTAPRATVRRPSLRISTIKRATTGRSSSGCATGAAATRSTSIGGTSIGSSGGAPDRVMVLIVYLSGPRDNPAARPRRNRHARVPAQVRRLRSFVARTAL